MKILTSLEEPHLRRRPAPVRDRRTLRARRTDQPRCLRDLRSPRLRSRTRTKGRRDHGQPVEPARGRRCARWLKAHASLHYLPPYLPGFNPILKAFAKLKAPLGQALKRAIEGLWSAIGRQPDALPPSEFANYVAAASYDAT